VHNPRTGETISRHKTESAAWRGVANCHAKAPRGLNRPGLHGGLDITRFVERIVVPVGAVGEPALAEAKNGTTSATLRVIPLALVYQWC
jgi:hypothetical protein